MTRLAPVRPQTLPCEFGKTSTALADVCAIEDSRWVRRDELAERHEVGRLEERFRLGAEPVEVTTLQRVESLRLVGLRHHVEHVALERPRPISDQSVEIRRQQREVPKAIDIAFVIELRCVGRVG